MNPASCSANHCTGHSQKIRDSRGPIFWNCQVTWSVTQSFHYYLNLPIQALAESQKCCLFGGYCIKRYFSEEQILRGKAFEKQKANMLGHKIQTEFLKRKIKKWKLKIKKNLILNTHLACLKRVTELVGGVLLLEILGRPFFMSRKQTCSLYPLCCYTILIFITFLSK